MKSKYMKDTPETYKGQGGKTKVRGVRAGHRSKELVASLVVPQAQSIITKFGGARELARTLKECSDDPADHYEPSTIYRWMYPRERGGTGGEIPTSALKVILKCARIAGVMLSSEDIYPHLTKPQDNHGLK